MRRLSTRKKTRAKKSPPSPPMKFEQALTLVRRGHSVRRRAWIADSSRIFRMDDKIFVMWDSNTDAWNAPRAWRPYPEDLLATDWERVRKRR